VRAIWWLDVLALPDGRLDVLDENELPAALAPDIAAHIAVGKQAILTAPRAVMARSRWPRGRRCRLTSCAEPGRRVDGTQGALSRPREAA
jgi:predicted RNA-binding protein associated with RNAse of E/G family